MKIREYQGYEIDYDPDRKRFYALKDGEQLTEEETQKAVEEYIDKLLKQGFKRIKAIRYYSTIAQLGEITSIKKNTGYSGRLFIEAWFVTKDEENKSQRAKIQINSLYQATPENLEIYGQIMALTKQTDDLEARIQTLGKQLKDPITEENIYKLIGWE